MPAKGCTQGRRLQVATRAVGGWWQGDGVNYVPLPLCWQARQEGSLVCCGAAHCTHASSFKASKLNPPKEKASVLLDRMPSVSSSGGMCVTVGPRWG